MRRVFPLRPAETSFVVAYDNGAFQLPAAPALSASSSSSSCNLKPSRRSRSIDFSLPSSSSSPRKASTLEKPSLPADYPEFDEVTSPSPPSSLWTSGVLDDGDSTSFNSSNRCHGRYISSSSSSSINFNPADLSISPGKTAEGRAAANNPEHKAARAHADVYNASTDVESDDASTEDLPVDLRVRTRASELHPPGVEVLGVGFAFEKSSKLRLPETPTYVIPRQVEEYMQNCLEQPSKPKLSYQPPSTLIRADNTGESRLHSGNESPKRAPRRSLLQSKDVDRCSCSVPFKYLSKCLKRDKRTSTGKDENGKQLTSPSKFSTSFNQLYAPVSSPRAAKSELDDRSGNKFGKSRADSKGKDDGSNYFSSKLSSGTRSAKQQVAPSFLQNRACPAASVGEVRPGSVDDAGLPLTNKFFGLAMVNDYVQRRQDNAKIQSFSENPRSASFHYETELARRLRFNSVDFSNERAHSQEIGKAGSLLSSIQTGSTSSVKAPRQKLYSMDLQKGVDRSERNCLTMPEDNQRTLELQEAEKQNMRTFTQLKLEINKLCREKRFLARELATEMNARYCQKKSAEHVIRDMEVQMEEKLISLEKTHASAKASLQQELDRRAEEWCSKLHKIGVEEKRLRDRVTKMALERVDLQKAIDLHKSRESFLEAKSKDHEISAQTWMQRHCQAEEEVLLLRKSLMNACNKLGNKDHELDTLLRTSKALEKENIVLSKEFARLRKAYTDQELMFRDMWQRLAAILSGSSDSKARSLRKLLSEVKAFAVQERAVRDEIDFLQSQLLQTKKNKYSATEESNMLSSCTNSISNELSKSVISSAGSGVETMDSMNKADLTQQHGQQNAHQLEVKEEEVGLLHSALHEHENTINDLQGELTSVKAERDGLWRQVQQMNQEAIGRNKELVQLKQIVVKLDDELMLKEGEISILRNTCSEPNDLYE